MDEYLIKQGEYKFKQKLSFLFIVIGSLLGFYFIPLGIIAVFGVCYFWYNTWKVHAAKCPECAKNVGLVTSAYNFKCHNCNYVFIEPPIQEGADHQNDWNK